MIQLNAKTKRLLLSLAALLTLIIVIVVLFGDGDDSKDNKSAETKITTTTTTLPPANSQACEFFKPEILATAAIVPDKTAVPSKDLMRCTYNDISGGINYLTLFLGKTTQCDVLKEGAVNPKNVSEISPDAYYFEVIDPTIIVKMKDRCYFIQGSKTLIEEAGLKLMAMAVFDLFTSVDATTTTTTIVVDPNVTTTTILLPGQNTTVITEPTTVATTTTKKK